MVINLIIFLIAIVFVVQGANLFVKSGSRIARKFGVSEFVIGLTLIALGTSFPELFSSVIASVKGQSGLVVGAILGANIANLTLIVGIAALLSGKIKLEKEVLKRDIFMLIFVIVLLSVFLFDGTLSRIEGFAFLVMFLGYNLFLLDSNLRFQKEYGFREFFRHLVRFDFFKFSRKGNDKRTKIPLKEFLILIFGGVLLFVGAKYLVEEGVFLANYFEIPIILVGIIISIGTTMPEMSVAIISSKKGYGEISVGNSIGSAITNSLLILGISAMILPLEIAKNSFYYLVSFLLISSVILALFIKTKWSISRIEGILLILVYITFLVLSFRFL
jgi:cation:H+ antiporter